MNKENLSKMDVVELKKKYKSRKITTGLLTAVVIAMFLVAFVFKPESSTSSKILPFGFLPLVIVQIFNDYKLYKELKSRQNK